MRIGTKGTELFGRCGIWFAACRVVPVPIVLIEMTTDARGVVLLIPVGLNVAESVGRDQRIFALGVAIAASASFLSPIRYQTNTMVFAPGRHRPTDYLRLGIPVTILVLGIVPLCMTLGRGLW